MKQYMSPKLSNSEFRNKTILVTGGTGSIGSEIVRQLLSCKPNAIRIFSRDEDRQYKLMHALKPADPKLDKLRFFIGDVRDVERLRVAMEGVDIVFHAAALKQVAICEYNPFEAIKTNIIGTQNVISVAREMGVDKVIGISTDKVAEPEGVLGVSKLMAEKLFLASYYYKGDKKTKFACVRFGNVLGSRGSLLPLIKQKMISGEPVPITDPAMTRFIMSIPQAVSLVLEASSRMQGQEIFILKMPAVRLGDLIDSAIAHYASVLGKQARSFKTEFVGKRDGEKMHEKLLADHEIAKALETERMYILVPGEQIGVESYKAHYPKAVHARKSNGYSSQEASRLSKEEIQTVIKEADVYL